MFKRHQITLISNPSCTSTVENLFAEDFNYYDKDGFELNVAEQKFYSAMNFPINNPILNHTCWQEPWFDLERNDLRLVLDHAMFLCRGNYEGLAIEQLKKLKQEIPTADYLLQTKRKWGFDFALDAVADNGTIYEVLHVEYDSYDYEVFTNRMITFEYFVRHADWVDLANKVWNERDHWKNLKGFDQNHWKSNYLMGWGRSELTEKSI